jgi:hypothetical protein
MGVVEVCSKIVSTFHFATATGQQFERPRQRNVQRVPRSRPSPSSSSTRHQERRARSHTQDLSHAALDFLTTVVGTFSSGFSCFVFVGTCSGGGCVCAGTGGKSCVLGVCGMRRRVHRVERRGVDGSSMTSFQSTAFAGEKIMREAGGGVSAPLPQIRNFLVC